MNLQQVSENVIPGDMVCRCSINEEGWCYRQMSTFVGVLVPSQARGHPSDNVMLIIEGKYRTANMSEWWLNRDPWNWNCLKEIEYNNNLRKANERKNNVS